MLIRKRNVNIPSNDDVMYNRCALNEIKKYIFSDYKREKKWNKRNSNVKLVIKVIATK